MKDFDPELASRAELIAHVDRLEGELLALRSAFSPNRMAALGRAFGITVSQARILSALADGRTHSREALLNSLSFDRLDDGPDIKVVDVFICKLRKSLAVTVVEIATVWGFGYRISAGLPDLLAAMSTGTIARKPVAHMRRPQEGRITHASRAGAYAKALDVLRSKQDGRGEVTITAPALSAAAKIGYSGSVVIRTLEGRGFLTVLRAPDRGGAKLQAGCWHLALKPSQPEARA